MQVLSLGLGLQSTALYYMSSMGELPRCDVAVFADTGAERTATLDYLHRVLRPWAAANNGIPIAHMNYRNIYTDLMSLEGSTRFASLPAYTRNPDGTTGMLRRQCTNEYKIAQVNTGIRIAHGLAPRKHTPPTTVWLGITTDELGRLIQPDVNWKTHYYPFVGYRITTAGYTRVPGLSMSRQDVTAWFKRKGIEAPEKSGCLMCPFQTDHGWKRMRSDGSGDWQKALAVDRAIRNGTKAGVKHPIYLHQSLKPLEEVTFDQGTLFEECSGYCHA